MSEKFESSIERKNVRLSIELGGRAILFDYMNTEVYSFPEPYGLFDHAYRRDDSGEGGVYFFKDEFHELIDILRDNNFSQCRMPYPAIMDEKIWLRREDARLDKDLERMIEE